MGLVSCNYISLQQRSKSCQFRESRIGGSISGPIKQIFQLTRAEINLRRLYYLYANLDSETFGKLEQFLVFD